jgi:hypothetical protein
MKLFLVAITAVILLHSQGRAEAVDFGIPHEKWTRG